MTFLNPQDFNVKGDFATDDTVAWAKFLAAIPDYSTIILPAGFRSKTGPIDISGRAGLRWLGAVAGSGPNGWGPSITYIGPAGGSVFHGTPCAGISFEGFTINANNLADFGFQAAFGLWSPGITTQRVFFDKMQIDRGTIGRPSFTGIGWGNGGTENNCERLVVRETAIYGSGIDSASVGINVDHSNAVCDEIVGNFISNCGTGIRIWNANAEIKGHVFSGNGVDIWAQGGVPVEIAGNRTELCKRFLKGSGKYNVHDNVFGSMAAEPASSWFDINIQSNGGIILDNNLFADNSPVRVFADPNAGYVVSRGNNYPLIDVLNHRVISMKTVWTTGYSSLWDRYAGGWITNETYVWAPP